MVIRAADPSGHDLIHRKDKDISAFNCVMLYVKVKLYSAFGEATCFSPKSNVHTINLQVKQIQLSDLRFSWCLLVFNL